MSALCPAGAEKERQSRRAALALALLAGSVAAVTVRPAAAAGAGGEVAAGRTTFVEQCSLCHTIGAPGQFGPDLKGVLRKDTLADGEPATEDNVTRTILEGRGRMPRIPLEPAQIADVLAYLRSL